MKFNPLYYHRHSNRLKGYNYASAGSYFVTLNCKNHFRLFGEIIDGKMHLNAYGMIAKKEWLLTPVIRPNTVLGAFVVMPDHLHGIIIIKEDLSQPKKSGQETNSNKFEFESGRGVLHPPLPDSNSAFRSPSQTLGAIIRGYMGTVTKQINILRNTPGEKVWQRNYHDHIIRTKWSFLRITHYILMNPKNWEKEFRKGTRHTN